MRRECIILLTVVLLLVTIGIVAVYSASAAYSSTYERLFRHLFYVGLGLTAMFIAAHFDYHRLGDPFVFRFVVVLALTLLVAVLIPNIGDVRGGAQRWIEIGGFSFQPSEFAKVAVLLLLALKLSQNQEHIKSFSKVFLPYTAVILLFATLVLLERDLGTPVVLTVSGFIVMVMAGVPFMYLLPSVIPAAAIVGALAVTSEYRFKRLTAFLDPWSHRNEEGYQLIQSMTAFVKGSMWGRGPGGGEQKLFYLPEAHTDFIFAVWGEETGLVGALVLSGLFIALLALSFRIAANAPDLFGALLAGGAVALIGFQAAFNMAVTVGLLPTKGLPLPFISMGGTSLIVLLSLMGIVLNVGLQAEPARKRNPAAAAA